MRLSLSVFLEQFQLFPFLDRQNGLKPPWIVFR